MNTDDSHAGRAVILPGSLVYALNKRHDCIEILVPLLFLLCPVVL